MNESRLVYSTERGRIRPECGKQISACSYNTKKPVKINQQPTGDHNDDTVRIQREIKRRKGKTITTVCGVALENEEPEICK